MNPVDERMILEEGHVIITSRRAVIGDKTYALSDLISVTMQKDSTGIACSIGAFVGAGLLLAFFSLVSPLYNAEIRLIGLILVGAAVIVALLAQPAYTIQIRSMAGRENVLQSMDEEYVRKIVDAINNAIRRRDEPLAS